MPTVQGRYEAAIAQLMETPSNLYSMQLRPGHPDPYSLVVNPAFSVNRHIDNTTGAPE